MNEELTDSQQHALFSMLDTCGCEIEIAQEFLKACNWNAELAAERFLEFEGDPSKLKPQNQEKQSNIQTPSASALSKFINNGNDDNNNNNNNSNVNDDDYLNEAIAASLGQENIQQPSYIRAPDKSFNEQLLPSNYSAFANPLQNRYTDKNFKQEWASQKTKKSDHLGQLFEEPNYRYKGSLDNACGDASKKNIWLLVNIQDKEAFTSHCLNRDYWKNKDYQDVIENSFVLWQYEKTSDEGKRFVTYYHVFKFPCILILDPRTKAKVHEINVPEDFSKFGSIHEQILSWLSQRPTPNAPKPKPSPLDHSIKANKLNNNDNDNDNINLNDEDDILKTALEMSLSENKENIDNSKEKNDNIIKNNDKSNNNNNNNNNNNEDIDMDEYNLTEEDMASMPNKKKNQEVEVEDEPDPKDNDATPIRVRLPNNVIFQRYFRKTTKAQQLFNWIHKETKKPIDTISLAQPMPRVKIEKDQKDKTLNELGLLRATLMCSFD